MIEWMSMDTPLVWKLPNSTFLLLPGIWISKPGVKRMKRTTDTKTGPQSAIFSSHTLFSLSLCVSLDLFQWLVGCLQVAIWVHMELEKERCEDGDFGRRDKISMTRKGRISCFERRKSKGCIMKQFSFIIHILHLIPIHTYMPPTSTNLVNAKHINIW